MRKMALKKKNCISSYIIIIPQKLKNARKIEQKSAEIDLSDRNLHKYFVFDKNKKLTYFDIFRKKRKFLPFYVLQHVTGFVP